MKWEYHNAEDDELNFVKKLSSYHRETGLITSITNFITIVLLKIYFKIFHRIQIKGKNNLIKSFPFIIIANHSSHLDLPTLLAILPIKFAGHVFPIAAGDTFFEKFIPSFFSSQFLNALPLWRKKCVTHNIESISKKLQNLDSAIIIFPEGTRSRNGKMAKFKLGIGKICAGKNIPIIPVRLLGTWESLKPNNKFIRFKKIKVHIGNKLSFENYPNNRENWVKICDKLKKEVGKL